MKSRGTMDLPPSRLDSLYKDFSNLKELNPEGYRANIDTWKAYLTKNYLKGSSSLFLNCGSDLLVKLRREPQGLPRSIDVVLTSLVESDCLVAIEDFYNGIMYPQEASTLMRWIRWGSWPRGKVNLRNNHDEYYLKAVKLIIKPVIEQKFEHIKIQLRNNIISEASGIADLVFSKQEFYRKCGFHRILDDAEEEREAMLFYLSRYKKLIVQDRDIIKVIAPEVNHLLAHLERKVTEDDRRIAALNMSLIYVESQIKTLRTQIADYAVLLKDMIINLAPRETQRKYLQGKKLVERSLSRLLEQQTSLLTVKTQINLAATNALLFKALEESNKVLKSINDSVGSVEKIEELLDEIKEEGEKAEEVNALIAKSPDAEDEAELDRELEEMKVETEQTRKEETVIDVSEKKENKPSREANESEHLVKKLSSLNIDSKSPEPREKYPNSIQRGSKGAIAEPQ
ncbi:hypothetical protein HG536_0F02160 [Torulaspora globosa]|uniref:Uncharacterized protein n=1 Tax=Torulaspora globosa TaxID=48254 RepID=A0A7G3ZK55_9SACH|nr:uncharacterized protein HG536_0F02160 [Torulaspora globosa]QLL33891.1 hypothetical protein HG536_0F02160 [Torulaspora globosa]